MAEYIVFLPLTEEECKKLKEYLAISSGAHMGSPPAGYKDNYEKWLSDHGWKLEILTRINEQENYYHTGPKSPLECGKLSTIEELDVWLKKKKEQVK